MLSGQPKFYKTTVEALTDFAIFELDREGRILSWNKGGEHLEGYSVETIVGQSFSLLFPRSEVESGANQKLLAAALELGQAEYKGWLIQENGHHYWAEVNISGLTGADGAFLGYTLVIQANKKSHLKTFEEQSLINQVYDFMTWTRDEYGAFKEPQPSWEAFTGQPLDEYMADDGFGWRKMLPVCEQEKMKNFWLTCGSHAAKEIETLVWSNYKKSYCPVLTRARCQFKGTKMMWVGIDVGIQESKRKESQLQEALMRLNFTVANAKMGMWEWNLKSKSIKIDKTVAMLFEIDLASFSGNLEDLLVKIHPDDQEKLRAAVRGGSEDKIAYDLEFRVVCNSKQIVYLACHSEFRKSEKEEDEYLLGFTWDISHLKLLEKGQADDEASRLRFAQEYEIMCHELRNPHQAISLSVSQLRNEEMPILHSLLTSILSIVPDEHMRNKISAHMHEIESLVDITSESSEEQGSILKSLSSIGMNESEDLLKPVIFNAMKFIEHSVKIYQIVARRKKIRLQIEWAGNSAELYRDIYLNADLYKLKIILSNLISNAVNYSQEGEVKVIFAMQGEGEHSQLQLTVVDSGKGVEASLQGLWRQGAGPWQGANSGLALVWKYIQKLGGQCEVQLRKSEDQSICGSSFAISIPCKRLRLREVQEFKQVEILTLEQTPSCAYRDRKFKILITDDSEINVKILRAILSKAGHECDTAYDGDEAVEKVKKNIYEIILLDFIMPRMNGDVAAQQIRAYEKISGHNSAIICVSANPEEVYRQKAFAAGMNFYLTKPVAKKALFSCLESCAALLSNAEYSWPEFSRLQPTLASSSGVSRTHSASVLKSPSLSLSAQATSTLRSYNSESSGGSSVVSIGNYSSGASVDSGTFSPSSLVSQGRPSQVYAGPDLFWNKSVPFETLRFTNSVIRLFFQSQLHFEMTSCEDTLMILCVTEQQAKLSSFEALGMLADSCKSHLKHFSLLELKIEDKYLHLKFAEARYQEAVKEMFLILGLSFTSKEKMNLVVH